MGNVLKAGTLDLQGRSWADYGAKAGAWRRLVNNRVVANPIKPRTCLASFDPATETFSLVAATQGVQWITFFTPSLARQLPRAARAVQDGVKKRVELSRVPPAPAMGIASASLPQVGRR